MPFPFDNRFQPKPGTFDPRFQAPIATIISPIATFNIAIDNIRQFPCSSVPDAYIIAFRTEIDVIEEPFVVQSIPDDYIDTFRTEADLDGEPAKYSELNVISAK